MSPGHKLSMLISELVRYNNVDLSIPRRKCLKEKEGKTNRKDRAIPKVCIRARIREFITWVCYAWIREDYKINL